MHVYHLLPIQQEHAEDMQAPQHIVLENTTGKEAIDTKQQNNNDTEVMKVRLQERMSFP